MAKGKQRKSPSRPAKPRHAAARPDSRAEPARLDSGEYLPGCWRLKSWQVHYEDEDMVLAPFGRRPRGLLLLTADGGMALAVEPSGKAAVSAPLYNLGNWDLRHGQLCQEVTLSTEPAERGQEHWRELRREGAELVLEATMLTATGERVRQLSRWRRGKLPGA